LEKYRLHQIQHHLKSAPLAKGGMGTIVLARQTHSGALAVSIVLLDVYCLGVKNADFKAITTEQLPEMMSFISSNEIIEACGSADAKKLINASIDYAAKLGFKPHADYEIAKLCNYSDPLHLNRCRQPWNRQASSSV